MSSPGKGNGGPLRQVLRVGLVGVGLWFVLSGVRERWPAVGDVLVVVLSVTVLIGLLVAGVIVLRRRRDDVPPP